MAFSRSEPNSVAQAMKERDRGFCITAAVGMLSVAPYLTQVPRTRPRDKNTSAGDLLSSPRRIQEGNGGNRNKQKQPNKAAIVGIVPEGGFNWILHNS